MITRTTTVGTLKSYRYDLNRSNTTMAKAMNTVVTRRTFNSYAEDPALATRCFQMRRSFLRTCSQMDVNESVWHKYDVAWAAMDTVSQDIDTMAKDTSFTSILTSLNDPDASGRNALGQSMASKAKSIVQTMNGRYGEDYVFAGADTLNVPFTWSPRENKNYIDPATADPSDEAFAPLYRYVADPAKVVPAGAKYTNDVSYAATEPLKNEKYNPNIKPGETNYQPQYIGKDNSLTDNINEAQQVPVENEEYNPAAGFKYLKGDGSGTDVKEDAASELCFRGVPVNSNDPEDLKKLDYFTKQETKYVDIGLGHKEKDGEAVGSSVFDCALQGVYFLGGYGTEKVTSTIEWGGQTYTTEVEVPNNIVSGINRMSEILLNCDKEDGHFASREEAAEFMALAHKFEDTASVVKQRWDEEDTESSFLKDNLNLLTDKADSISEQFMALEDVDPAAAISDYMFARYCYDAALKVGNSVLSQSLMDYMNL